jgi:hypothetical protein
MELDRTVTPSPVNPLGVKGVGEAGTIGATPCLANAVVDALAPFGVRHADLPFKRERIWKLMHESNRPNSPSASSGNGSSPASKKKASAAAPKKKSNPARPRKATKSRRAK